MGFAKHFCFIQYKNFKAQGVPGTNLEPKPKMGFVYLGTGNQHTVFCTPALPREALPRRHSGESKLCAWVPGSELFFFFLSSAPVSGALHLDSCSDNPCKMKHPSNGSEICPVGAVETPCIAPGLTGSSGFSQPVRLGRLGPKQAEALEMAKWFRHTESYCGIIANVKITQNTLECSLGNLLEPPRHQAVAAGWIFLGKSSINTLT